MSDGIRHGKGISIESSGIRYQGDFRDGKKHGKGKVFHPDGTINYDGEWRNGKPGGKGTLIEDGSVYDRVLRKGKVVKRKPTEQNG